MKPRRKPGPAWKLRSGGVIKFGPQKPGDEYRSLFKGDVFRKTLNGTWLLRDEETKN